LQHRVIKALAVEADHEIGAAQFFDERVHVAFAIDFIFAASGAVGHADAHPHVADIVPAADFISRLLRFEIEIDNVFEQPCRHAAQHVANARGEQKHAREILLHTRSQLVHRHSNVSREGSEGSEEK